MVEIYKTGLSWKEYTAGDIDIGICYAKYTC